VGRPCVHLAALLLKIAEKRPEDQRLNSSGAVKIDSRLDPEQDLLFFVEPEELKLKPVMVLGRDAEVASLWSKMIPPASGEPEGSLIKDLSGQTWRVSPATVAEREDGHEGPPRPRHPGEAMPPLSLRQILQETAVVTPDGRKWTVVETTAIRLRFNPLLGTGGDEPLYEPFVELLNEKDGPVSHVEGGLVPGQDAWIILDAENAVAGVLEGGGDHLWFIRLMLSRRSVTASDIRARFLGPRPVPQEIRVELPDMPESLPVLDPILVLQVSGGDGVTDFHPRWRYGELMMTPKDKGDVVMDSTGRRPRGIGLRNRSAERELFNMAEDLLADGLSWRRGRYAAMRGDAAAPLRLELPLVDILAQYGSSLMDAGVEVRLEDRPVRIGGSFRVNARRSGDLMEMNAEVDSSPLELDAWMEKGGLVRTGKAYFTLTDRALEQLRFLKEHGMENSGFLSTSPDNLSLIDAVYADIEASQETAMDLEHKKSLYMSLADFSPEGVPPLPESFNAVLRPYQQHGYAWLLHLRNNNLGGCLADDMGLGKTVQTLAYLNRLKADGRLGSTLLVGPVVTLGNWESEIRRFAPTLSSVRYAGPAQSRFLPNPSESIDIVLVSYQTLRNDIERFLDREWDHVILDEAHYVKNASSRTFKAVRSLTAAHRLSLTGTPLENHLNELWSQMTFLNPGILGSLSRFNEIYVRPVEKNDDENALSRLSDIVSPFILRRKKSEVLDDLPPKDEAILRCDMSDDQAEAYHSMKNLYLRQVTGLLTDEGLKGSRIEIFSILTKLRLLAIHPPMAGEPFAEISSGKMSAMDNLMEEILEEDHKTLVFSQFLGALDRAEMTCRTRGWQYSRLTGSTKNREEPIRRFTEDPYTRVFLLSLRAGGVGINLTAADYVILLDPWWNPAVEAQAVDRAHRMGQKRSVMAYRLITSGTIEEKVLELQEKKKNLITGVLGDGGIPDLSEEEILSLFS
ncbi:MAG: DEAD/DEAH box helicase, partial [Spirochaetaceae bacterium]|nr:DEAD/DEAH box helicase [Spirochaetaceae bacterium]